MHEFLIRRTDGEWFDFGSAIRNNLRLTSVECEAVASSHDLSLGTRFGIIRINYEGVGLLVEIDAPSESQESLLHYVEELHACVEQLTGQQGKVICL